MDTSTNYVTDKPHEVLFNSPPNYNQKNMPRRSVIVFDRLSQGCLGISRLNSILYLEIGSIDHFSSKDKTNQQIMCLQILHLEIGMRGEQNR